MRNNNHICLVIKLRTLEENFYTVDNATCPVPNCCDTNADARSVCDS